MGSLAGHVLPGSFFVVFAIWWLYNVFYKYFLAIRGGGRAGDGGSKCLRRRYRNTAAFHSSCCPKVPMEGIFKVTATTIGFIAELATAYVDGKFTHIGNTQHMTMYFFFGLNGAMDIAQHYRLPLPPDADYVSAALAFLVEGVLFLYHLHGRTHMDIQVHMLLLYLIFLCAVSTIAEMCKRFNVLPALCRVFFTLYQGTWFIHVGFILYPPAGMAKWDEESHSQMMIMTAMYCWHAGAIFVFMLGVGWLAHLRVRCMSDSSVYQRLNGHQDVFVAKMDPEQVRRMISDESEMEEGV